MADSNKNFGSELYKFVKFCFFVLQAWFCAALVVGIMVWRHPFWHSHLLRFTNRVWAKFVTEKIGSTSPGFVNSLAAVIVSLFLGGLGIWFIQGWPAMRTHVIETIAMGIVVLFTASFLVYGTQFAWEVVRVGYKDHQDLVALATVPKPTCPTCPTCPSCPASPRVGGTFVLPERPLDVRCQQLADCPSPELSRRAQGYATELESISTEYFKKVDQKRGECIDNWPIGDERQKCLASLGKVFANEAKIQMGIYREKYHTDVIAMRNALADRTGDHDHDADYDYKDAGITQIGNVGDLGRIASDLRRLAGKALSMRQHE